MSERNIIIYNRHFTIICVFNSRKVILKDLLLGANFSSIEKLLFISDFLPILVSLSRNMVTFKIF